MVLKKLLSKLTKRKKTPRNRKKYRKVTNLLFEKGDCLAYKHTNGNYYLLFVYSIDQHRSECLYSMGILNYCKVTAPEIEDVLNGQFLGRIIPTSLNSTGFEYGFAMVRPDHNDLIKYISCFNKIGAINIRTDNNCIGSYGGVITQQDFEDDIVRIIEKRQVFGNKLINVSEILVKQ